MGRRLGEGPRIRQLAAEVESADEGEGFAESRLAVAEPQRQGGAGAFAQDQLGANAGCIRRGKEKDARRRVWRGGRKVPAAARALRLDAAMLGPGERALGYKVRRASAFHFVAARTSSFTRSLCHPGMI